MRYLPNEENPNQVALEEMYLASSMLPDETSDGNLKIKGVKDWFFTRRHSYWAATTFHREKGLPLEVALTLHNTKHPISGKILGDTVRAGGHAGGICPTEYVAQPIYNEDLASKLDDIGIEKLYSDVLDREYHNISCGDVAKLCNEGKLCVQRYVDIYHIDDIVGLSEFIKVIRNQEYEKIKI